MTTIGSWVRIPLGVKVILFKVKGNFLMEKTSIMSIVDC